MTDKDELKISIQQYEQQLLQVEDTLKKCKDEKERDSLQSLKSDLKELIDLTKQTLNQSGTDLDINNVSSTSAPDDEMALFMSEIKRLDATAMEADRCDSDEQFDEKLRAIKDELDAMIGRKCSAPHEHTWGGRAYHNAIVCGLDDSQDYDLVNIKDFRVRILFTNPTHKEMIPCSYFLNGDCKFDSERCHFSHGELIPFSELQDYTEPDFSKLQRNCIVLAKTNDKMWHKGRVLCSNFVEKNCKVRLDREKTEIDCNFEDLLPIFHDDDQSNSDSNSESDEYSDFDAIRHARLVEKSLLTPAPDQALGEWEKHTRGIGSKLMQKMGYVVGTGLGTSGDGIIVPISAQILPPGRSLDHCMELREAANGDKDLFSVERKLKRIKKKQETVNAKSYEREKSKTDMFSFLNDNILASNTKKIDKNLEKSQPKFDLKNQTIKNLNVESLKVADDIRKKEKEIQKVKEAMKRHTTGDVHNRLQAQLMVKNQELKDLKKFEISVTREQTARKHTDKLSVF